jgi:hypothetical protein
MGIKVALFIVTPLLFQHFRFFLAQPHPENVQGNNQKQNPDPVDRLYLQ